MAGYHGVYGTAAFTLGNGIDAGDKFAVIFFDNLASGSTTITGDTHYAVVTDPSWVVPGDGDNIQFQSMPSTGDFQQLAGIQASFQVGNVAPVSYLDWASLYFNPTNAPNAQTTANPEGDEFANLFEYAFGLNPLTWSGDHPNVPVTTIASDVGGDYLITEYRRPVSHDGVEVSVEVSTDLELWTGGPLSVQLLSREVVDGDEVVRYRSTLSHQGRLFMRVTVQSQN